MGALLVNSAHSSPAGVHAEYAPKRHGHALHKGTSLVFRRSGDTCLTKSKRQVWRSWRFSTNFSTCAYDTGAWCGNEEICRLLCAAWCAWLPHPFCFNVTSESTQAGGGQQIIAQPCTDNVPDACMGYVHTDQCDVCSSPGLAGLTQLLESFVHPINEEGWQRCHAMRHK